MKLFVFDVDGTLVGISQRLRKKTIEALNSILDNGDAIAIASGRNFSGIKKYLEKLHDGKKFLIVANGAALYDYEGNNIYSLCVDDKVLFDIRNSLSYLINETEKGNCVPSFAIYMTLMIKYIERIADHAVNVAEWVIYISSGFHKDKMIF